METGFIKLYRSLTEWEWYKDTNTMRVWLHLLLTANWKDGRFEGYEVPAGSVIVGRKKLAKTLGLTEQQVRTALEHLKSTNEITIKTTSKFSIINIEKWRFFQSEEAMINQVINQQNNQRATSNQPAFNQQVTTIEERKKERMQESKKEINRLINNNGVAVSDRLANQLGLLDNLNVRPTISERLSKKLEVME